MNRDIRDYTKAYLRENYADFEEIMIRFRREKVLSALQNYRPKKILEVGCGMDSIANYYKNYSSFTIVEPSTIFYDKAKSDLNEDKKVKVINDFIETQISSLQKINFDFIIISSLLHEVEKPKQFLTSILQLLLPPCRCTLHINVPNAKSFHLLWAYESGLIQIGDLSATAKSLQQHTVFDIDSLCALVKEVGLEVIESGSYFIKPFNHFKMSRLLKNQILDETLLRGLDKMIKHIPHLGAEIFVNTKTKD